MKITRMASMVLCAVLAAGCASVGNEQLRNETESSVQGKIIEGKTTKSEIRSTFGSPLKTSFTDGGLAGRCKKLRTHVQPDAHHPVSHDFIPRNGFSIPF